MNWVSKNHKRVLQLILSTGLLLLLSSIDYRFSQRCYSYRLPFFTRLLLGQGCNQLAFSHLYSWLTAREWHGQHSQLLWYFYDMLVLHELAPWRFCQAIPSKNSNGKVHDCHGPFALEHFELSALVKLWESLGLLACTFQCNCTSFTSNYWNQFKM